MKELNLYDKVLRFAVHNGFLTTVSVVGVTHIVLLILSCLVNIKPLILFNVVSVIIYIFGIFLCRAGQHLVVYFTLILEISIYSLFGTYYVGWRSCTPYFLVTLVPITLYFGSQLFGKKYRRLLLAILLSCDFGLFSYLYCVFYTKAPRYFIPENYVYLFGLLASFAMVFSIVFYNVVYIYSAEMRQTKLETSNKELQSEMNKDVLTKWLNRRGFFAEVKEYITSNPDTSLCFAFIDIDNFKRVNDSYGHDGGDEILLHVTKLIKNNIGSRGVFCRWGGEELVIALKGYDLKTSVQAMDMARSVIEHTKTVFYNKQIGVTISVGVAEYSKNDLLDLHHNIEIAVTLADERMYKGKQQGKNIVISQ